jgi:hypothetical protein
LTIFAASSSFEGTPVNNFATGMPAFGGFCREKAQKTQKGKVRKRMLVLWFRRHDGSITTIDFLEGPLLGFTGRTEAYLKVR